MSTETDVPPLGRRYVVGERRLVLHQSGTGGPAVVFVPGVGLSGLDFWNVQDRAAEFTTSVVYDRAGTGWSDAVDLPRSATDVVDELRDLLRAAGVPAPYLLAGHSLGALYVRRYAQLYPAEVAGLLLLDPGHEDILDFMPAQAREMAEQLKPAVDIPDLTSEQLSAARTALTGLHAAWPEHLRVPLVEQHLVSWRTSLLETRNETEVYAELRAGGSIPDVPLIVLTALGVNPYWAKFLTEDQLRDAHAGVRAMHVAMAESVPRGELREVEGASHQYLTVERPDLVIDAIRDMVKAIKSS